MGDTGIEKVRGFVGGCPTGLLAVSMINFYAYHSLSLHYILYVLYYCFVQVYSLSFLCC